MYSVRIDKNLKQVRLDGTRFYWVNGTAKWGFGFGDDDMLYSRGNQKTNKELINEELS